MRAYAPDLPKGGAAAFPVIAAGDAGTADRALPDPAPALTGGAFMVVDELFSRERLGRWIARQTPAGQPELAS